MNDDEYPELYREGIRLFNDEEFFECHEVLEDLWAETIGESRLFYQGLIQAAVALFHFGNENLGGARKLYHAMHEKLAPYAPRYQGVDVTKFLADMQRCFQPLLESEGYPAGVVLQDELVPKIVLEDEAAGASSSD